MKFRITEYYVEALVLVTFMLLAVFGYAQMLQQQAVVLELPAGFTRSELTDHVGGVFKWPESERNEFTNAFAGMQWNALNNSVAAIMAEEFSWQEQERRVFLEKSAMYTEAAYDILGGAYVPGAYEFPREVAPVMVAAILVERITVEYADTKEFLVFATNPDVRKNIKQLVDSALELLPDLVPYPPQSVSLKYEGGKVFLVFDTTYYNRGRGNLELFADPKTSGIEEDIVRTVYQRIYRTNGTVRLRPAGSFQWHEEHLHFHFADFIEYRLEAKESARFANAPLFFGKSTFCIRDVSRIGRAESEALKPATYLRCGRELQGVSVGWGDTYFFTYAGQRIDITNYSSGMYTLTFIVNPEDRFDEITTDNNESSVIMDINKERGTIVVLESFPKDVPGIEHIHKSRNDEF
jgi:hypothetical protein